MKKKFGLGLLVLLLSLGFFAGRADANGPLVIFDGGAPDYPNGVGVTSNLPADDFVLSTDSYLTDVHFWTLEGYGAPNGSGTPWDGTLEYFLFADNGGQPAAAPFLSGNGQNVVKTNLGLTTINFPDDFIKYGYRFDLETPELLSGGTTYWLGLHLVSDYTFNSIYWSGTFATFGSTFHTSSGGTFDNWHEGNFHLAFNLTGTPVPEPSTLLLFGSGLVGLGFVRRKFKR
jgi:hypothetical protein